MSRHLPTGGVFVAPGSRSHLGLGVRSRSVALSPTWPSRRRVHRVVHQRCAALHESSMARFDTPHYTPIVLGARVVFSEVGCLRAEPARVGRYAFGLAQLPADRYRAPVARRHCSAVAKSGCLAKPPITSPQLCDGGHSVAGMLARRAASAGRIGFGDGLGRRCGGCGAPLTVSGFARATSPPLCGGEEAPVVDVACPSAAALVAGSAVVTASAVGVADGRAPPHRLGLRPSHLSPTLWGRG